MGISRNNMEETKDKIAVDAKKTILKPPVFTKSLNPSNSAQNLKKKVDEFTEIFEKEK